MQSTKTSSALAIVNGATFRCGTGEAAYGLNDVHIDLEEPAAQSSDERTFEIDSGLIESDLLHESHRHRGDRRR